MSKECFKHENLRPFQMCSRKGGFAKRIFNLERPFIDCITFVYDLMMAPFGPIAASRVAEKG